MATKNTGLKLSLSEATIAMDIVLKSGHVPALVGTAGIGKTEVVKQIASTNGYFLKNITCSLMQEGDLMLPVPQQASNGIIERAVILIAQAQSGANVQEEITEVLSELEGLKTIDGRNAVVRAVDADILAIIEYLEQDETHEALLFLDELNRASVPVQAELMNLVLARELKGVTLPDRCHIVIAMNPSADMDAFEGSNYAVNSGDMAIMNRMTFLNIEPVLEDWASWGMKINPRTNQPNIDIRIIEHLQNQVASDSQFNMKEEEGSIVATPRSWKFASDILSEYESRPEIQANARNSIYHKILMANLQGTIGVQATVAFMNFLDNYATYLNINDILNNQDQLTDQVKTKFTKASEIAKKTLMKNVIRKIEVDLERQEQLNASGFDNPSLQRELEYLNHNPIEKTTELIIITSGRAKEFSKSIFDFSNAHARRFWDKATENEDFAELALLQAINA